MAQRGHQSGTWAPSISPSLDSQRDFDDAHWRKFDSSVNAVSFGFVATAVLISMFLVMAIFERFLRTPSQENSTGRRRFNADVEAQIGFTGKFRFPSPKVPSNPREVSVIMPGDHMPSFIAQPAPVPCAPEMRAPERISIPRHQNTAHPSPAQNSDLSTSPSSSICERAT